MATKVIRVLIDDIDGTSADETVSFRIDGENYDIDLSAENAAGLREALTPYIASGRKKARRTKPERTQQPIRRASASSVRKWAQQNGYTANSRGKIPAEIMDAHEKATA